MSKTIHKCLFLITAALFCLNTQAAKVPIEFPLCNGSLQYNNIAPCGTYTPELALSQSSGSNDYVEMTVNLLYVSDLCLRNISVNGWGQPIQVDGVTWLWNAPVDVQQISFNFQDCTAEELMHVGWKYY